MSSDSFVVECELLYANKGRADRHRFRVRVGKPRLIDQATSQLKVDAGAAVCSITFEGLDVPSIEVHGIDELHALSQGVDVDRHLRAFAKQYDFFWVTGESYFED